MELIRETETHIFFTKDDKKIQVRKYNGFARLYINLTFHSDINTWQYSDYINELINEIKWRLSK